VRFQDLESDMIIVKSFRVNIYGKFCLLPYDKDLNYDLVDISVFKSIPLVYFVYKVAIVIANNDLELI
jgi:hypothetical protein